MISDDYNSLYILLTILSLLLIGIGTYYYFYPYYSDYIPVNATITGTQCTRYIISTRHDEFHCLLTLRYKYDNKHVVNNLNVVSGSRYDIGSELKIYINKYNPIEIITPKIPPDFAPLCLWFIGGMILTVLIGSVILDI